MSGLQADGRSAQRWQGLLVSVRAASEASDALAGGAAIIDVKEPARGPLGAASAEAAAAVAATIGSAAAWTLACGELAASGAAMSAVRACVAVGAIPAAAKAGPAGLSLREWRRAFATFAAGLPAGVESVAVAYADWQRTAAPDPDDLIAAAAEIGCRTLLIDTGDKAGPGLFGSAGTTVVAGWIAAAHAAGMAVAAAGRLTLDEIAQARGIGADVVAVRGAVCRGGRSGAVDRNLVREASTLLTSAAGLGHPVPGATA
jgi:uncharacterized protein (UPF0264 family)